MELREKIINAINGGRNFPNYREHDELIADRILAIPEIKKALALRPSYYPGGIPRGDPGGCEAHPKRG